MTNSTSPKRELTLVNYHQIDPKAELQMKLMIANAHSQQSTEAKSTHKKAAPKIRIVLSEEIDNTIRNTPKENSSIDKKDQIPLLSGTIDNRSSENRKFTSDGNVMKYDVGQKNGKPPRIVINEDPTKFTDFVNKGNPQESSPEKAKEFSMKNKISDIEKHCVSQEQVSKIIEGFKLDKTKKENFLFFEALDKLPKFDNGDIDLEKCQYLLSNKYPRKDEKGNVKYIKGKPLIDNKEIIREKESSLLMVVRPDIFLQIDVVESIKMNPRLVATKINCGTAKKLVFICSDQKKHSSTTTSPNEMINGRRCKECTKLKVAVERKFSQGTAEKQFAERGFKLLSKYETAKKLCDVTCLKAGHVSKKRLNDVKHDSGCAECSGRARLTLERVKDRFLQVGLEYISGFDGSDIPCLVKCIKLGHETKKDPSDALHRGCSSCSFLEAGEKLKYTQEEAKQIFADNGFDLISEYVKAIEPCRVICHKRRHETIKSLQHVYLTGCRVCGPLEISDKMRYSNEEAKKLFAEAGFELLSIYEKSNISSLVKCHAVGHITMKQLNNRTSECYKCSKVIHADKMRLTHEQAETYFLDFGFVLLSEFKNRHEPCLVKCLKSGHETMKKLKHAYYHGCVDCAVDIAAQKNHLSLEEAKSRYNKDNFDLLEPYLNYTYSHKVFCRNCKQITNKKLRDLGYIGCKNCSLSKIGSKGASNVRSYLKDNKIEFSCEIELPIITNKHRYYDFSFDYKGKKIIVEFDGEQHFSPGFGATEEKFLIGQMRDRTKTFFALQSGITMIRISDNKNDHIKSYLDKILPLINNQASLYLDKPKDYHYLTEVDLDQSDIKECNPSVTTDVIKLDKFIQV